MADVFKSVCKSLSSVETFTVYGPVTGTSIINGIHVANKTEASNSTITLKLVKDNISFYIVRDALVPFQASYQALDNSIPLNDNDYITATSSLSGSVDLIVSVLEIN